ncbi:hypothetical protein STAHO0001_0538 [Staphylococcus hominis SK119]|nr:hypothetical protein STAHO0001_0538 [Staphylococcus hominis SK119]
MRLENKMNSDLFIGDASVSKKLKNVIITVENDSNELLFDIAI